MEVLGDFWSFVTTWDHWWGPRGILSRTRAHIWLSFVATFLSVAIAAPPAVLLGHKRIGGTFAVGFVNLGRALPSLAVLALAFTFTGLGFWPTCIALVVLGLPPIFANTYTGLSEVPAELVESANAMGMTRFQVLWRVELPMAMPLIITGVRISALQIIATATLGALIGFQGLGLYIVEGLAQGISAGGDRLLTGAIGVALLAMVTEMIFGVLLRAVTPWSRAGR